ncbi:motilin-like isoform X2 [Cololabis saira]|uniref:motilin-like isoform X2 n=1 Tax=Cololabis saira TaxID=129043 RepID=UPI002AD524CA|nr:motilin-like isoform X2 [Cololabis saira]
MSMRGAVASCVVLVCLVALLVERTEGHITFFSPKEMMLMKEREGRKDMEPRSEHDQSEEQLAKMGRDGSPGRTLEVSVRLSPKQLDQVAPVLKEIIHEIVDEHQKAK